MPRTDNPKKHVAELCEVCGYELRPEHDARCPMCARFEQLRIDFTVPRPSDLAARRPPGGDAASSASEAWPPTVADYRAILAERRVRSTDPDQPLGAVIRTPGLMPNHAPKAPEMAGKPAPDAVTPQDKPQPQPGEIGKEPSPPASKKARARKAKGGGRRSPRTTAAPADTTPPPSGSPGVASSSDDPAATAPAAPLERPSSPMGVADTIEWLPPPRASRTSQVARPAPRLAFDLRAVAGRWVIGLAVVAAGAIIGALVTILLSPR